MNFHSSSMYTSRPRTASRALSLFSLFLLVLGVPALADGSGDFSSEANFTINAAFRDSAMGDFNNDGYDDLIFFRGGDPTYNRVYLNDTQNGFTHSTSFGGSLALAGDVADFNGDGRLDVVVAKHDNADEIWYQNANGTFSFSQYFGGNVSSKDVVADDVDGDGDMDVIVATIESSYRVYIYIYLNNGNNNNNIFTAAPQVVNGTAQQGYMDYAFLTLGDIDNDGDNDLVSTSQYNDRLWRNDNGTFAYVQEINMARGRHGAIGDVDGDGYNDLLVVCTIPNDPYHQVRIFSNTTTGGLSITYSTIGNLEAIGVDLDDFDSDGDLDAFILYQDNAYFNGHLMVNDGSANFLKSGPDFGIGGTRLHLGDLDNDGDTDVAQVTLGVSDTDVFTLHNIDKVEEVYADFTADATEGGLPFTVNFTDLSTSLGTTITSWAWDFDNDGVVDSTQQNPSHTYTQVGFHTVTLTVTGGSASDTKKIVNYILAGNRPYGTGFFDLKQTLSNTPMRTLVSGDVDGDTDPDLMTVQGLHQLYINDDQAGMSAGNAFGASLGLGAAYADLDGDGDNDLWISKHDNPDEVWLNDGDGNFTFVNYIGGSVSSRKVILDDVDGDGDNDAIVSIISTTYVGQVAIYLNNGNATFAYSATYDLASDPLNTQMDNIDMELGDLDGDSFRDIFFVSEKHDHVLLSNGNGTFTLGQNLGNSLNSDRATLGDIDGDGDLDALIISAIDGVDPYKKARVWTNNGSGTFTDTGTHIGGGEVNDAGLADLDEDGDLDVFLVYCVSCTGNMEIWFNDGFGAFTNSGQNLGTGGTQVIMEDMDLDGDADAVVAAYHNQRIEIWLNRGDSLTFTVDSPIDTVDANPGDGIAEDAFGNTTLRAAIMEANASIGLDTIILPADTYTLTITGTSEDLCTTGDLDINDDLIITGAAANTTTINASGIDRVFHVSSGKSLTMTGVTVTGGDAGSAQSGGAMANEGTTNLDDVSMHGNSAGDNGGAIHNTGYLTITNSAFHNNNALDGAAISNASGATVTVSNSTFSGNDTVYGTLASLDGAAIDNSGSLTASHLTVTDNEGGGIRNSGSATLTNTLSADNIALANPDLDGAFTSGGGNLIGDIGSATGINDASDTTGDSSNPIDPQLSALGYHEGTTQTHWPLLGSPALDQGIAAGYMADQRGYARPIDADGDGTASYDIGAVEWHDRFLLSNPVGGEILTPGDTYSINWISTSVHSILMELSRDGGSTWETLDASLDNDGEFGWLVQGVGSNNCVLRISRVGESSTSFTSGVFSILQSELTVTAPNGGESWEVGNISTITWTHANFLGTVDIEVSRDGGSIWETIAASETNDGSYDWTVAGGTSTTAVVRISSSAVASITDSSDANFSLITPPLLVTSPNGGESLLPGDTVAVNWNSSGVTGNIHIEYSTDGGATWSDIAAGTGNDGEYHWFIPAEGTSNGLVRVTSLDDPTKSDVSNTPFTILTPSLTVTTHNGGEVMTPGTITTVGFDVVNFKGGVSFEVSYDGGSTWSMINNNLGNGPTVNWNVPSTGSSQVRFRFTSRYLPQISDTSDADNTILTPSLTLTAHNGGVEMTPGTITTLGFDVVNFVGGVTMEVSYDNGTSWNMINDNLGNGPSFNWNVPATGSTQVLFRVTSRYLPELTDTSDATNTILTPSLTLNAHNGGEVMTPGSITTLNYDVVNFVGGVTLEVSYDNGTSWNMINDNLGNGPNFNWNVPATGSTQVLFRVTSRYLPELTDTSDATNTILTPSVTLTSPNGGVSMTQGATETISYSVVNFIGGVTLEVSYDNGSTWSMINNNLGDGPNYNWTVASQASTQVIFRVTSRYLPELTDVSDGTNTIL